MTGVGFGMTARGELCYLFWMSSESISTTAAAAVDKACITLPDIPALSVNARLAYLLTDEGELKTVSHREAKRLIQGQSVLVCHGPYMRGRLGDDASFLAFDVLELFAFVHPAKFCVPTPHGLAVALGMVPPESFEDYPMALMDITKALLSDLQNDPWSAKAPPLEIAGVMGAQGQGWAWSPFVFDALGETYEPSIPINSKAALNVWKNLPEWAEEAPEPPPSYHGVSAEETQERLEQLRGAGAEVRESQIDYAKAVAGAFAPVGGQASEQSPPHASSLPPHPSPLPEGRGDSFEGDTTIPAPLSSPPHAGGIERGSGDGDPHHPHIILAEAGTGVGKTLGYLAPASVWAEKNKGTVWISTYTKNLQRQIDQELDKLYPNPALKEAHIAVRKGRENYLCLLNMEDAAAAVATARSVDGTIAAGIMARWVAASKDGDLTGADFPGWLSGILGYQNSLGLADRRGECIYSACDHYSRCFVEHSVRKAARSRIVVANHALVMISAALSSPGEDMPSRYIFDEGHHLFDAADSAFAAHLTAQETRDLRRWILGAEGGRRSRARGLKRRAEDLAAGHAEAEKALLAVVHEATCLTAEGWTRRLKDSAPSGPCEEFLALVHGQVYARAQGRDGPYSLETETYPALPEVMAKAKTLRAALMKLQKPMKELAKIFRKRLAEDQGMMESDMRKRLDAVAGSLEKRAVMTLSAWGAMLEDLDKGTSPESYVDWMAIERTGGRAVDVGLYRHHTDPMEPFAAAIKPHVQGMAVTSATLRDSSDEEHWATASARTGANYLSSAATQVGFSSPFDYGAQTKIFIINDVNKNDLGQVSGAYRALFEASGGGALGLFTAISRLRAVHGKIAMELEENGLSLYAQHVDEIDPGTLVDMFRDDTHACLLGTDAVRDGVDVPGESLRLIVFDRVPWPRPSILHKARRAAFGGRQYDEMITRLKLKQAFGRLIRHGDDKGVFVMLDSMLPSRLHNAFPAEAQVEKTGLKDTVEAIKGFLTTDEHR